MLNDGVLKSWNVHYVNLDRLPSLYIEDPKRLTWLNSHVSLMLSDREREQKEADHGMKPLTEVKLSIHSMMVAFTGVQESTVRRSSVFGLNRESNGGIDTLIFATHLRLDLAAHTVVMDAFVLPLSIDILDVIGPHLGELSSSGSLLSTRVSEEELISWKLLIPALVERCRTWKHKKNCAYSRCRSIPLSVEHGKIPICRCGRGIVTDAFRARKEWEPFAPYVTRIAISSLFAVSYLDPVAQWMTDVVAGKTGIRTTQKQQQAQATLSTGLCGKCGKKPPLGKLLICSACKAISYCSKECQVADWRSHKVGCRKPL